MQSYSCQIAHFGTKQLVLPHDDVGLSLSIFNICSYVSVPSTWVHFRWLVWFVLRLWVVNKILKPLFFFQVFCVEFYRLLFFSYSFGHFIIGLSTIRGLVSSNISYTRTPLKYVRVAKWLLAEHKIWHQQYTNKIFRTILFMHRIRKHKTLC